MSSSGGCKAIVCMPKFSLAALLLVILKKGNNSIPDICFDSVPRYLRAIGRILRIREASLLSVLGSVSGFEIYSIPHGDQVADYPNLQIDAMQRTSRIVNGLTEYLKAEYWVGRLGKLIGQEPALAFTLKQVADVNIFHNVLALSACCHGVPGEKQVCLVLNVGCPEQWYPHIQRELEDIPFNFFEWPAWLRSCAGIFHSIFLVHVSFARGIGLILRRGAVSHVKAKDYDLITEFIDPGRLETSAYDADYWVDGIRVKPEKVLFYLTSSQWLQLKANGHSLAQIESMMQAKGYQMAVLDRLPYSWGTAYNWCCLYFSTLCHWAAFRNPVAATVFCSGLMDALQVAGLFEHFSARHFIYLTFPNGHTSVRLNDGIITGLCRTHGIRSIGCQTRTIYNTIYECCFDCFDTYIAWGPAWHAAFPQRMEFVKEVAIVGCIYLDSLLLAWAKNSPPKREGNDRLIVTVFPTDMGGEKQAHTLGYTTRFLSSCARIAANHPEIQFLVKMKDPEHVDLAMRSVEFADACRRVEDNFEILKQNRFNYGQLLQASDIVIAIGFTTPGCEALLMGKRAIYYSELTCAGQAFRHIPSLIASSEQELNNLFHEALEDHLVYCEKNRESIALLDPYRDGHALSRITAILQPELTNHPYGSVS